MANNLDPKKFQREAEAAADSAARHGEEFVAKAANWVEEGVEWAAPRAQKLWDDTLKAAAPKIEEAAEKVRPYLDEAEERVRPYLDEAEEKGRAYFKEAQGKAEDYAKRGEKTAKEYAKRGEKAAKAARKAAAKDGSLVEKAKRAGEATRKELEKPKKSTGRTIGKFFGWALLGTAAAGVGYLLWRRSQPIEDPWAEEYWADLDTDVDVPDTPAEPVAEPDAEEVVEEAENLDEENVEGRVDPTFDEENVEKIEEENK